MNNYYSLVGYIKNHIRRKSYFNLMKMKLTIIISILFTLQCFAKASGQITLSFQQANLEEVISSIRLQSDYNFVINSAVIKDAPRVSVQLHNATLQETLDKVLLPINLNYTFKGKSIIISKKAERTQPKKDQQRPIHGQVTDSIGRPLQGVTVSVGQQALQTVTDRDGKFHFTNVEEGTMLTFRLLGYATQQKIATYGDNNIILKEVLSSITEVNVISTGFQSIPKERATGSFEFVDNEAINRRVSTNVIDRLEGITNGLLFNHNPKGAGLRSNIKIRGESTIYANDKPLIILDNFEFQGNLSDINPNDIENITVLKDAAAASIWGAKSGNGVIVLTTKKGKLDSAPKVALNSNVTVGNKPDLFYGRQLGPKEYIEIEKFLFAQGYYDSQIISPQMTALTPAVELMLQNRNNTLSDDELQRQLTELGQHDVRNDFLNHFYRQSQNQQYALNISGGGSNNRYYISGGYDKNLNSLVRNDYERVTLNANNTVSLLKNKLDISTAVYYAQTKDRQNNTGSVTFGLTPILYPYAQLVDQQGNALPVDKLRREYIESMAGTGLLDWNYRPLDEINLADNSTTNSRYLINLGLNYKILKGLDFDLKYQYGKGTLKGRNHQSEETYFTRNYINQFSSINASTGAITRPVPLGGILDLRDEENKSQNIRTQLNLNRSFGTDHEISAIAGFEVSDIGRDWHTNRLYGYKDEVTSFAPVNHITFFPYIYGTTSQRIDNGQTISGVTDRYRSYYANASYTYIDKYTLSGSVRRDESNLFGVRTNQKGVPLWSIGAKWDLHKENFFQADWIDKLSIRTTYGYNGNVDKNVTAYLTGYTLPSNVWGNPYTIISNPPNEDLRWERVQMVNFGAEFALFNNRLSGNVEYFTKRGKDIMGDAELAPSTGMSRYRGNSANIKGHGMDVSITSKNLIGNFSWQTTAMYNNTFTTVSKYLMDYTTASAYVTDGIQNPIEDRALFALYSYRWGGLNSSGDPQGYLDGELSTDWSGIAGSQDIDQIVYHGAANPTHFGSLMNTFSYKNITLSFNILYQFGFYFRRPALLYADLLSRISLGDIEYNDRWQQAGDESRTHVPAMVYPTDFNRDSFYTRSEIMVERGDHIRLQDIQLGYQLPAKFLQRMPIAGIGVYGYANNLGILWRANKHSIDPAASAYPMPATYAIGLNVTF
ncbi:SusC/RagA family TonB-linked outer membrane protein [Sphingobacterium yanglingense]|uniref:TonB-linked SusC/RagA family outer membrane protein n=1 Tax=Sphingobacterium yanglingense TaxID=1437280 RepID=A0A4R6WEY6_9SPHI|nr:SusC/RagA family TonB-linked outer membrane protein [Sphingobacterium yanglingense]TDQ73820.1 TonB-linked SusC/RagA family outer membrane protein [Sphingobacterium yanglingense]